MADIEKVINGLKHCTTSLGCFECPYSELDERTIECQLQLDRDALELLKGTTGHWIYLEDCSNSGVYCSECKVKVADKYPMKKKLSYFCPHCGTRMEGKVVRM